MSDHSDAIATTTDTFYTPKTLHLYVIPKPGDDELPRELREVAHLMQQVRFTRVTATEKGQGDLLGDIQKHYTQDFVFTERQDKHVYNTFRQVRANTFINRFDLLMVEPDVTFNRAIDVWLLPDARINQVRVSCRPEVDYRELTRDPETAFTPHTTTIQLVGDLQHQIELLALGDRWLSKQQKIAPALQGQ